MPLQAREWVYDLSGNVQIPVYQSVYRCPKCGTAVSNENGFRYNERKEKYQVSKDSPQYHYLTTFESNVDDGIQIEMDEYIEVTCGICSFSWAEACVDYEVPESTLKKIADRRAKAEAKAAKEEAEEIARLEAAADAARVKAITDAEYTVETDMDTRSQWEKESAESVQPFAMLSPEAQAQREVDSICTVLDTPTETVLPDKKEMFIRKVWHFVDPRTNVITAGLSMVGGALGIIYLFAKL